MTAVQGGDVQYGTRGEEGDVSSAVDEWVFTYTDSIFRGWMTSDPTNKVSHEDNISKLR